MSLNFVIVKAKDIFNNKSDQLSFSFLNISTFFFNNFIFSFLFCNQLNFQNTSTICQIWDIFLNKATFCIHVFYPPLLLISSSLYTVVIIPIILRDTLAMGCRRQSMLAEKSEKCVVLGDYWRRRQNPRTYRLCNQCGKPPNSGPTYIVLHSQQDVKVCSTHKKM